MTRGKKAEGEITAFAIAAIVIGIFTVSLVNFGIGIDQTYNTGFDDSQFNTFNRINTMQANTSLAIATNIEEGSGEISSQGDTIEGQARAAFESSKILFNIPGILADVIIDAFNITRTTLKLDDVFMYGFIALIFIIVAASAITLYFKVKP